MDNENRNKLLEFFIGLFMILNPFIVILQVYFASRGFLKSVVLTVGLFSLLISVFVAYSGYLFRKSLGNYFSGSYISNVSKIINKLPKKKSNFFWKKVP